MQAKKREKLVVTDLIEEPLVGYPPHYRLSHTLMRDEMLLESIRSLHMLAFEPYRHPESSEALFEAFRCGLYPLYKERYVTAYFGGKMMYLQMQGWKSLPANEDIFKMENWLI